MFNAIKIIISAVVIFIASEIAKKDTLVGAIIVSLPLISLLSIIWIYIETRDVERIISFSYSVFSMIIPSLSFFLTLPFFLKKNISFSISLILSITVMVVLYFGLATLYRKIGYVV
tara:strand:- start:457 stop:804 length:348 start_codon:yes stop_codon:yes gene_type:complete